MNIPSPRKRITAILWFLAAALAFIAVAIRYVSDREMKVATLAFGIFCAILGVVSLKARRPSS